MATKRKSISLHVRRVPQRTCVACRRVGGKRDLVRLVRTLSGTVDVDLTGKKSGRGAYLCRSSSCWETGITGGRLEHSLKLTLGPEQREALMKIGRDLMEDKTIG